MAARIGLGVVGLGRRWRRYQPALAALGDEVRVVAVHDPVPDRAAREAARWRCAAAGGAVELAGRDDVDAVLVMPGGWLGLWPVEQAVLAGKPVYSAVSPAEDQEHADAVRARIPAGARVHAELWPALGLLVRAYAERVQPAVGAPRLIQGVWGRDGGAGDPLGAPAVLALVDACGRLFGADAVAVTAAAPAGRPGVVSLLLEFGGGGVAQLSLFEGGAARGTCRLQVQAEGGAASLALPAVLRWRDDEGAFSQRLPPGTAEFASLGAFLDGLADPGSPFCDLETACRGLDLLRAARRSRERGRRVALDRTA